MSFRRVPMALVQSQLIVLQVAEIVGEYQVARAACPVAWRLEKAGLIDERGVTVHGEHAVFVNAGPREPWSPEWWAQQRVFAAMDGQQVSGRVSW